MSTITHAPTPALAPAPSLDNMVWIPGGTYRMGSDQHYAEEAPAHPVTVDGFWMDTYPVTNAEFARFVEATDYITFAERTPGTADHPRVLPELLVPASAVFCKPGMRVPLRNPYIWWRLVPGANWRQPLGPDSSIDELFDHPVVHIAGEDAEAYARWAGKALPTEAEWEWAARGGLDHTEYAWGHDFAPGGRTMANTWQGEFPYHNLLTDGYEWTSPVGIYPANSVGLFDMIGNVWEWTADWYQPHSHKLLGYYERNPQGALREHSHAHAPGQHVPRRVIKGGSFLSAPNYCRRYRPAARMPQPIDSPTCHIGFRCIVRAP